MEYTIRPITNQDLSFQEEMVYQSIFVPEGKESFPRDIIYNPLIYKYFKDWGREGDFGLIAESIDQTQRFGAIWYRFFTQQDKGFGYIDDTTPELHMAVSNEHRNKGLGSKLMQALIEHAKSQNIKSLCLSVEPDNPSVNLYLRLGFKTIDSQQPHYIMKLDL